MRRLFWILLLLVVLPGAARADDFSQLRRLPAQDGGRLKPLDTVAAESVRFITGKARFQNEDPIWTSLRWMADPDAALAEQNIEFRNKALQEKLGLDPNGRWYSFKELSQNPKVQAFQQEVHRKMRQKEELSQEDKEFSQLLARMQMLVSILDGTEWHVVPNSVDLNGPWGSLSDLKETETPAREAVAGLLDAAKTGDSSQVARAAGPLASTLAAMGPQPPASWMEREVQYNSFHAFRKAWVLYLLGFFFLLFAPSGRSKLYWVGMLCAAAGFGLHLYGFVLRCLIAGRPPVTNMYESVIWVAFGAVLFALIFELVYRTRFYLLAALTGAIVALILADNLPAVLDPSIKPLTPVLRNNFWLTIHVLTITLSYAAFLLSLGLGHMVLWGYAFQADRKERLKSLNKALYKSIQVGVLLLAAGTILGGVWANYSWGRFWGWDPKEVWALIALLGYLALLHGRYAGWLRHFGLAAGSIIAYLGVLMAWYGVNFVLGAGLHSYGFGNGGVQYVAMFCVAELLFVAALTWRYRQNSRATRPDPVDPPDPNL